MYVVMAILSVVFLIPMILHPNGALKACHTYCRWVIWTARWMVGIKVEVRGDVPTDEVLVAAKHQSFFDIIVIFGALPRPKFIMKRQLLYAPILGQYAYRLGCVPVDRGKRAEAVKKMVNDVSAGRANPGQLVIYPQGTRVAPGVKIPYKQGPSILYTELQQDCVPVALNVGLYWPKRGIMRYPGKVVVEFMDRIPAGMPPAEFTQKIEDVIETRSDELMAEAGFKG